MSKAASRRSGVRAVPRGFERAAHAVLIGASAGGVEALLNLLPGLPAAYPLPIVVVLHQAEDRDSTLPELFAARMEMPVRQAGDKELMAAGTLYFAPPGYHLLLEKDRGFALSCDAPLNFSRPSIDVLFESACDALAPHVAAVLLTGANADGAGGLACIGAAGGLTVVQEPDEASSRDMPQAAIARRAPDFVLPLQGIRQLLSRLSPLP